MSHPPSQRPVPNSLADRLLHATTPSQVADVLLDDGIASLHPGTCLLWSNQWPQAIEAYPSPCVPPEALAAATAAVFAVGDARVMALPTPWGDDDRGLSGSALRGRGR